MLINNKSYLEFICCFCKKYDIINLIKKTCEINRRSDEKKFQKLCFFVNYFGYSILFVCK